VHSTARYQVRPRKDRRGVDLISDALPFGLSNATGYAQHRNVIETHEHKGDFKEW
jgi:hypothetical protein